MIIERLSLKNFRNIKSLKIELSPGVNILYGANAQGKTNILEALFLCATGRSQRTHLDKDMIMFGEDDAHIQTVINKNNINGKVDIHLKRYDKKGIAINGITAKKLGELFGIVNIVLFSTEDLKIIKEGPSFRRRYMDIELCQLSKVYYYNLQRYYKVLKERNELLKKIQKNNNNIDFLDILDNQLEEYGAKITSERGEFLKNISERASNILKEFTDGYENLSIEYKPSADNGELGEKLIKSRDKDIYYGTTSYGIHKDDILFNINGINARDYASQGQQRSIIYSLKLAEIDVIREKTGNDPILMLDDILSELDKNRQKFIINSIENIQTIITCTGIDEVLLNLSDSSAVFRVDNGRVLQ